MSLQQPQKLTEAKAKSKFQSLNINNIYQGAANKHSSKSLPQKHGLQSLGKVPTARKAPANLPSVKSEKGGNDPTVVLVPSGGAGWTKDGAKAGQVEKGDQQNSAPKPETKEPQPPVSITKPSGVKSWSSVTGAGPSRPNSFGQPKHFGQEFPSLKTGEGGAAVLGPGEAEKLQSQVGRLQLESQAGRDDYGPNLRPQTYGNWTQGGIKGPGTTDNELESDPIVPPQPHKPTPPGGPSHNKPNPNHPSANQYNSIMPPFMDAMVLPTGPPETLGSRRVSRDRSGPPRREPQPRGRTQKTEFTPPSIIDKEKLRRMDDLAGDDWTYDDNNFDYNKRLQSDDEEQEQESAPTTDANWADQVEKVESSQPYNFYQEMKKPGFGVDEDEVRRTKKSEEVMKNIERARQRREEEENRYRRPNSQQTFKSDDRSANQRFDEGMKENKTPTTDRKEWGFEDKRGQTRHPDERRDPRFEDINERDFEQKGPGYHPQRFERKDEFRNFDEPTFEDDFKQYQGRKDEVRSFDDRERIRSSEEKPPFSDFTNTEENRGERRWGERSPVYNPQSLAVSDSPEFENGTGEWGLRPGKSSTDWAEDVENNEEESTSRPNSRDARFTKDPRSQKDDRSFRGSVEKTKKSPELSEDKPPMKTINPLMDFGHDKKPHKKPATTPDLRGYFRDQQEEPKKVARAAPGPITREKLEAADHREHTGMTQLTKRDAKPNHKPAENEVPQKLNPLIDSDLLENISDDEDGLLDTLEREEKAVSVRGRGRGRGGLVQDTKKIQTHPRGGRGVGDRGGRGTRGGRGEMRGRGQGRFGEMEQFGDESEEARRNRKNYDKFPDNFNQPPPGAFMPRGQPSRRGRGEGKPRGSFGRGGMSRQGEDDHLEEIGEWNESEYGRGGNIPPRMQRKRDDKRPMKTDGDNEMEEWDTNSEHSNDEKRRREAERGRGRGGRGWESRGGGGRRGGMHGFDNREHTPESDGMKKRSGIPENIDLNDFASVVVVDQDNTNMEQEFDQNEAGEFMQVVNRKGRPPPPPLANRDDRRSFERTGPKMGDKSGYDKYRDQRDNFNKQNKTSYERRQNKLPPRLAKVREVSRAQARSGGVSPSGMEQNGWPEGDKMGVFQVEDLGTNAWEKPPPRREKDGPEDMRASPKASKENGGIQQTMVFENTALKGGKVDKSQMDKSGIQLPVGLGKPEDNMDVVKLDFGFGGDDLSGQGKPPMSIPRSMSHLSSAQGLPASPSTDDLSAKLANTKKLWDSPGMPAVPENPATVASWNDGSTFNENSGFEGFQDPGSQNVENNGGYDKNDGGKNSGHIPNMKHPHHHQLHMDQDNRQNNPMQFSRNMPGAIPSPPTQMNQMGAMQPQPWGFPMDRTSTIYNPYGASQLLMQGTHSIGTDLFTGSNGAGGYRLQGGGHYPGSVQSTTNNVLISQANLINSGVKHSNQIGPIGTKAGNGANASPYLQSGLGALPNTFIQYEPSSFNYVNPNAAGLQRGNAPPTQTAFYQTLASRQPQLAALNAAMPGSYNHAMSQQQIRANHVAGLPFIKPDLPGLNNQKSGLSDNFGNSYNGRSAGPPSPKTKLKIEQQQQQQAKMAAAGMNNLTQLAQLRMSSLGYNIGIPGVTAGYPSPIARPPMNHGNGNHGHPTKVDYYIPEVGGEGKAESGLDKGGDGGKEAESSAAEAEQAEQENTET